MVGNQGVTPIEGDAGDGATELIIHIVRDFRGGDENATWPHVAPCGWFT